MAQAVEFNHYRYTPDAEGGRHVNWQWWQEHRYYGGFEIGWCLLSKETPATLGSFVLGVDFLDQKNYYLAWVPMLTWGPFRETIRLELFRAGDRETTNTIGFGLQLVR